MKKIIGIFSLFFLFSCSPAPQPISSQFSQQEKFEAAHHWEILANDFAKQIKTTIQKELLILKTSDVGHASEPEIESSLSPPYIYIQTNDRSSFGRAFRTSLITELTKLKYTISYSPKDAMLVIKWSVNKIHHDAERKAAGIPGKHMAAVAIGYGIYKLFDTGSSFGGALAIGALLDLTENTGGLFRENYVPQNEIILTLSISKGGDLISRESGTYYINAEDTWHYSNIADFEGQPDLVLTPKIFEVVNNE